LIDTSYRPLLGALLAISLAWACSGCESTAEKSADIEKHAKHEKLTLRPVPVTKESPNVEVTASTVVHSSEGTAVVVELRNTSSHAIENAQIEITVRDAKGDVLFQNDQPGAERALTTVSLLPPGKREVWVDDQVQTAGVPASAIARVGEGARASGSAPKVSVSGTHPTEEGGEAGAAGNVRNDSKVAQQHLVVYAVARKGGKIVAAGRAGIPEVAANAGMPFQVYFIGDPKGAQIEASAPPTTF
jgi:hypothetical protein